MRKIEEPQSYIVGLFLSGILVFIPMANVQATAKLELHGTLIEASCTAKAVDVEFGNITLDKVSTVGGNPLPARVNVHSSGAAVQPFTLSLSCTRGIGNDIQYQWRGTSAAFNSSLLSTDVQGLALELIDGDTLAAVPPDSWQPIDAQSRSKQMQAVLVRDASAVFTGGEFNATATIAIQVP
ncbi:TPA: fimbrial protein [Salmonella enterica]